MNSQRAAFSPLAHADAMRKVLGLGIGKLPNLLPIARERAMIARAMLRGGADRARQSDVAGTARVTEHWNYRSDHAVPGDLLDRIEGVHGLYAQDIRVENRIVTDIDHTVTTLRDATMYTNGVTHRSVFDAYGSLVPAHSSFRGKRPESGRLALKARQRIPGRTLNAYGTLAMAGGNYSHWLMDGIAMLMLVEKVQGQMVFDHVVVPPMFHDFHLQSLELLGIAPGQVIEMAPLDVLHFEELVCATPPRGRGSAIQPGWANDAYRTLLSGNAPLEPGRKLYVSRRDAPSRNFINEEEIAGFLEARGFETVELSAFDLSGKAQLFAQAGSIVSLSGAGLANVMFCASDCTVLEVQPPRLLSYNIGAICSHVGCGYDYLLAQDESVMSRYNPYYGELSLDLQALDSKMQQLGLH